MKSFSDSRREIARLLCSQADRTWGGLTIEERDALMGAAEMAIRARDEAFDPPQPSVTTALLTVKSTGGNPPSLTEAAAQLGLQLDDLDQNYGVVLIDPTSGTFVVRGSTLAAVNNADAQSDPQIDVF